MNTERTLRGLDPTTADVLGQIVDGIVAGELEIRTLNLADFGLGGELLVKWARVEARDPAAMVLEVPDRPARYFCEEPATYGGVTITEGGEYVRHPDRLGDDFCRHCGLTREDHFEWRPPEQSG